MLSFLVWLRLGLTDDDAGWRRVYVALRSASPLGRHRRALQRPSPPVMTRSGAASSNVAHAWTVSRTRSRAAGTAVSRVSDDTEDASGRVSETRYLRRAANGASSTVRSGVKLPGRG